MDKNVIGERLRNLRLDKGVTTKIVAKSCGISPQAVTMYETGERVPRDDIKIKLANFYKKSVSAIFFN